MEFVVVGEEGRGESARRSRANESCEKVEVEVNASSRARARRAKFVLELECQETRDTRQHHACRL